MPDAAAQDDLDSPWKEVIEHAFPEFIDFYFPDARRQIDWPHGYTFLDKELQKIVRDGELGRRYVPRRHKSMGSDPIYSSTHCNVGNDAHLCQHHDKHPSRRQP